MDDGTKGKGRSAGACLWWWFESVGPWDWVALVRAICIGGGGSKPPDRRPDTIVIHVAASRSRHLSMLPPPIQAPHTPAPKSPGDHRVALQRPPTPLPAPPLNPLSEMQTAGSGWKGSPRRPAAHPSKPRCRMAAQRRWARDGRSIDEPPPPLVSRDQAGNNSHRLLALLGYAKSLHRRTRAVHSCPMGGWKRNRPRVCSRISAGATYAPRVSGVVL